MFPYQSYYSNYNCLLYFYNKYSIKNNRKGRRSLEYLPCKIRKQIKITRRINVSEIYRRKMTIALLSRKIGNATLIW